MNLTHIASCLLTLCIVKAFAEDPAAQFEREVRPLLKEHCFECHGPDKQKGGLRLDQKEALLHGGDSEEPAILPGKSGASLLIKRTLSHDADDVMPPKGKRLEPAEIASLQTWIDAGAHWPASGNAELPGAPARGMTVTDRDRQFWAFQAPRTTDPVYEGTWPRQKLDYFVGARLREHGLEPTGETSRNAFIRRVTFDITGLPPTPDEVDHFLNDKSSNAHERVVERLLGSPQFGERMASMWLPLARFGEDQAHQVGDDTKFFYPNAHLYRAWVIDAFNRDLPYDQFLKLQLAADRIPGTAPADQAALGFLGLGPKYYNRNQLEVMADEWEDRVDTVTRTMLGLTVACARCHDHKFDPITTADYHALAGVFASTQMVNKTPGGLVEKENVKAEEMQPDTMHIVQEGEVQNLNVFVRGNVTRKGALIPRRFIEVLGGGTSFADGSGRRELAEAIASRANPLTARVIVNRIWAQFFAQPLVSTPSNFGHSGALPSNRELLDDLAVRFMEHGWSVKSLVREIALSSTYRQGSGAPPVVTAADPSNEWLGRMNRRRLTVEQWRDAVLAVSGELADAPGAKSRDLDEATNRLRTVYARISRLKLNDILMQFDYPDANVHAEKRSVTTTPMQKLFVLNSPFIQRYAGTLAARLQGTAEMDTDRVTAAYLLLFSREPDVEERDLALRFLLKPNTAQMTQWERYAQLLLASNEMLYVD
ncbi:MAG: Planctomycete cytochrome [Chthoniobacteraceae bacterium]|nr:Planctomycete cytochrome [Chthoniobacteraceae bacterium]